MTSSLMNFLVEKYISNKGVDIFRNNKPKKLENKARNIQVNKFTIFRSGQWIHRKFINKIKNASIL